MRYDPSHKAKSRARILEAARLLFRAHGLDQPSIDTVMGAAGLTRGAFYAHFSSREELVQAVLAIEPGLVADVRAAADADAAGQVLTDYLDPMQRQDVIDNCGMAAHPVDVRRGPEPRREAYAASIHALVDGLVARGWSREQAVEMAIATLGGAVLAAAMPSSEAADEIDRAARRMVERYLQAPDEGS